MCFRQTPLSVKRNRILKMSHSKKFNTCKANSKCRDIHQSMSLTHQLLQIHLSHQLSSKEPTKKAYTEKYPNSI